MIEQTAEQKAAELADKCFSEMRRQGVVSSGDGYTHTVANKIILRELNIAELVKCKERVIELEAQWKEYCGEYDKMMARWKDEKGDIAARCGFPWEFGVGLEPWCAADELRKERDQLRAKVQELEKDKARLDWLEIKRIKDEQIERNVIFLKSGGTLRTAIDNAREGKPTSAPEHSPENRTTDP